MRWNAIKLMRPVSSFVRCSAVVWALIAVSVPPSSLAQEKASSTQNMPSPNQPEAAAAKPAAPPSDLSKEALVFDKLSTRIREESDGTGTRQSTARIRILADAGVKEMAVLTFTYTALNQQIDIGYVRVIKPDGTVVITPNYNVQDLPVLRHSPEACRCQRAWRGRYA